ncbi:MAG: HAMP domain-containing protein [Chloroflexi bacterium]|nr:HAMP domain-containing protein [Chloroflexota bacterium]
MSLRLRLTLLYSGLLAGLLFLIVVITLTSVQDNVRDSIDTDLKVRGDQVAGILEESVPTRNVVSSLLQVLTEDFEAEVYIQIRDTTRRITSRTDNLTNKTIRLPEQFYKQAMSGRAGYYDLDEDQVRVYYTPIKFGGEVVYVMQVARHLESEQAILNQLATSLFWIIVVALVIGATIGYWLAGITLRPIQEATVTALAITRTGRLDRRVPVSSTRNDEIGELVNTFNEMLDRLQELFDKQRRFSGDISHELRTPLTTILGNTSLLKRINALPPDEEAEMLDEIEQEAQHMRRLVSDLLLLAQADADMVLSRERVELDTILLEVYRQAKRRSGNSIDLRLLHEDQAIVMGDADRLRQMLVNLINNAIQYTPKGGSVDLSLSSAGISTEIIISDTGQGIPPEDLPHIFDRFYRADKARSRAVGGTGLGLSIVKWVVDAHGGDISVESTEGEGTTFRVQLPLAAAYGDEPIRRPRLRAVQI